MMAPHEALRVVLPMACPGFGFDKSVQTHTHRGLATTDTILLFYFDQAGGKKWMFTFRSRKTNGHSKGFPVPFCNPKNSGTYLASKKITKKRLRSTVLQPRTKLASRSGDELLINCEWIIDFAPLSVYIGFRLFSLLERRWMTFLRCLGWNSGLFLSWANDSVCAQSCPTPPGRSAGRSDQSRPWNVRILNSTGFEKVLFPSAESNTIKIRFKTKKQEYAWGNYPLFQCNWNARIELHFILSLFMQGMFCKMTTWWIQNPEILRVGQVGAPGGPAGRGRARLCANGIIRRGSKNPGSPARHR